MTRNDLKGLQLSVNLDSNMSHLKIATNLFLEKLEMSRLISFLEDGYKGVFQNTFTPGLIKTNNIDFINGRVEQDIDSENNQVLKIQPIQGIDLDGNFLKSNSILKFNIPSINTWYWIKVSYISSNVEKGTFSIDSSGMLIGNEESELMSIFRQVPNFPTKIKFLNSVNNPQEYEVLEVINNQNAKLNGISFVEEEGLKLKIVGTFTPGIIIPESDKYPFNFDSVKIDFVEELELNEQPNSLEGKEFFLARLKILDRQLIIQDKRLEYVNFINSPIKQDDENVLIGIESVRYTPTSTTNINNIVDVSWCMRSDNWAIDSSKNIVTIFGSSQGGRFKSVLDFTDGDFNGWRVYTSNGNYSRVISSIRMGNAINLLVDVLDVNNYSLNGGNTFIEQTILITPDFDFIELEFTDPLFNKNRVTKFVPINTDRLSQELIVSDFPLCKYIMRYRYSGRGIFTDYKTILSDELHGYYNEESFEINGTLKPSGLTRVRYDTTDVTGFITLNAYKDSFYYLRQRIDINIEQVEKVLFGISSNYINLTPHVSTVYQVIDNDTFRSSSNNMLFINLSKTEDVVQNGSRFTIIIDKETLLGNTQISVVSDFNITTGDGTIHKIISSRDSQYANINEQDLQIDFIYDGLEWNSIQNYRLDPGNELRLFSGSMLDYFDETGKGLFGGWKGYAISNGQNGTKDLSSLNQLEVGSTTNYLVAYCTKI